MAVNCHADAVPPSRRAGPVNAAVTSNRDAINATITDLVGSGAVVQAEGARLLDEDPDGPS